MVKCIKCGKELTESVSLLVLEGDQVICLDCFRLVTDEDQL